MLIPLLSFAVSSNLAVLRPTSHTTKQKNDRNIVTVVRISHKEQQRYENTENYKIPAAGLLMSTPIVRKKLKVKG